MATTTESLKSVSVTMYLADGTNSNGTVKTVSVNLGALNPESYDATKVGNIVYDLIDVLAKSLYTTTVTMRKGLYIE